MADGSDEILLTRWAEEASRLKWERAWETIFTGPGPRGRWFDGGTLNVAVNCLDRHLPERADQVAIYWEGEPGDRRTIRYRDLHQLVVRNPWPGMFLDVEGEDHGSDRYWSYPGAYATGDLARLDPDGTPTVVGRKDDLVKVLGQFVSLAEISTSLRNHPIVRDVEVVRLEHEDHIGILAVVVLDPDAAPGDETRQELLGHIADTIGGLARPDAVVFAESFPAELSRRARREVVRRLDPAGRHGSEVVPLTALTALAAAVETQSE